MFLNKLVNMRGQLTICGGAKTWAFALGLSPTL